MGKTQKLRIATGNLIRELTTTVTDTHTRKHKIQYKTQHQKKRREEKKYNERFPIFFIKSYSTPEKDWFYQKLLCDRLEIFHSFRFLLANNRLKSLNFHSNTQSLSHTHTSCFHPFSMRIQFSHLIKSICTKVFPQQHSIKYKFTKPHHHQQQQWQHFKNCKFSLRKIKAKLRVGEREWVKQQNHKQ